MDNETLTRLLACPHGCTAEGELDLERLRRRLYVWGSDQRAVGCRVAVSLGATRKDEGQALLKLARDADQELHRIEDAGDIEDAGAS